MCLAPFCKKPIRAVLRGVTSNQIDPSVGLGFFFLGCIYLSMVYIL